MSCMPRLMLRAWCVSAEVGVHWQDSLLVCTIREDGARVPRCRVRLASSWARALSGVCRLGWQVWDASLVVQFMVLPILFLAISAVVVTRARDSSASEQTRGICRTLICPSAIQDRYW